jgi:hypothetical protein
VAPKQRNIENAGYPRNWRARLRGSKHYILFRVPASARALWGDRKEVILGIGDTLAAAEKQAYQVWADKIVCGDIPLTMGQALERYEAEVVPKKAPATIRSNRYSMKRLRSVIPSAMPVIEFRTHHAYQYRDACAKKESPKKANLDLEVLSHVFTKCLEWGTPNLIEHPIRGKMEKISLASRTRYAEDWEVAEFLSVASEMLKVYVPLKYALGIDKSMMLTIQMSGLKPNGIEIEKRRKIKSNPKARKKFYPYEDADGNETGLKPLVDAVLAWRKKYLKSTISPWLFCTTKRRLKVPAGVCFVKDDGRTSGFDTMWQKAMARALAQTKLEEKFTEHDLCAKSASDVETDEEAARLRGHLDVATTVKTYRRKSVTVLPVRPKKGL